MNYKLFAPLLLLVVAACTIPPGQKSGFRPVVAGSERTVINAPVFNNTETKRVVFHDVSDLQEYSWFRAKNGARAEFDYAELALLGRYHGYLQLTDTLNMMVKRWKYFNGKQLVFSKAYWQELPWNVGGWVKPFQAKSGGVTTGCIAVSFDWDPSQDDAEGRTTKALFGYLCGKPGEAVPPAMLTSWVESLGIRGISQPGPENLLQSGPLPPLDRQNSLKALATGMDPAFDGGNSGFPFFFARYYSTGGDRAWDD